MMPGLSHEMHVYVYEWWDSARNSDCTPFLHTSQGMLALNAHCKYHIGHGLWITPINPRWRVTPAVFQMFRLHMQRRHGLDIAKVQREVHGGKDGTDVPSCCYKRGHRRFYL